MAKVTIYTQVFNAGPYLRQCLDSVLAQTHTDWEHIVADAGSTDGSVDILKDYAAGDNRVKFIQLPENRWSQYELTERYATGEYYASLDHDDWWEPEFLERMLAFLGKNDVDIVFTGVVQYYQKEQASKLLRKLNRPVSLSIEKFAQNYEKYGKFANARWASLMYTRKYLDMKSEYDETLRLGLSWRSDTILMLKYLERMKSIGIDNTVLQHYRNYAGSQIQKSDPTRLKSEEEYYKAVQNFLEKFGAWGPQKQDWAKGMFLVEMLDALQKLEDYCNSNEEKLQRCNLFLECPLTKNAITYRADPSRADMFISKVKNIIVSAVADRDLSAETVEAFQRALQSFAPNCAGAVVPGQSDILAQEPNLVDVLLKDDREKMQELLLDLVDSGKYDDKYDLGEMLLGIVPKSVPLYGIQNVNFFKAYPQICRFILGGANITAMDLMTGLLLENREIDAQEDLLHVYLNLSAQMGQAPAFIFGKIRQAQYYHRVGKTDDCIENLKELEEMGAGDQEEVMALKQEVQL